MKKSINQPWAISDKFRTRYGNTWAELDFVFQDKISAENFKSEPLGTLIGEIHVAGNVIPMRYKDLMNYAKSIETFSNNLYAERVNKTETFEISLRGKTLMLNATEIGKLSETIAEALNSTMRAYELGLYL